MTEESMKNETLNIIMQRRSVRAYTDQNLSQEEKNSILDATLRAPTAGNMMLYSIIEIEDQKLKDRLAVSCDNQPFIANAPYVLLFTADYQRWVDIFINEHSPERALELGLKPRLPQEGDLMLAVCDALIAAQTAVIAAESLGIGSCYIGDITEHYRTHQEMFNLPKYVLPIALLCFGFPKAGLLNKKLVPRFDRQYIVHKNTYRYLDALELNKMMRPAEEIRQGRYVPGATSLGQNMYLKKFISEFSTEMSRSVREMIQSWSASD
jgi:FMN reductase (NADPH)